MRLEVSLLSGAPRHVAGSSSQLAGHGVALLLLLELQLLNVGLNPLGKLLVLLHSSLYVLGGNLRSSLNPLLNHL